MPFVSSIERVYLAFIVLRRLLLNTLSWTYSSGYMDTSSKLSILASTPGGQKKPGLGKRTSEATINLVGVRPKVTWRNPRPLLVVSANGDSTRIVSKNSQYSERSSLRILLFSARLCRYRDARIIYEILFTRPRDLWNVYRSSVCIKRNLTALNWCLAQSPRWKHRRKNASTFANNFSRNVS